MNTYDEKLEQVINALLDGELSETDTETLKARAGSDQALAQAIIEAYQLRKAMDGLSIEPAPASLRKKLRVIPREHRERSTFSFLQPRWVMALAAVPLAIITISLMQPDTPSAEEIEQARYELALAFAYLDRAGKKAGMGIETTVGNAMTDAIAGSMIRNIKSQYQSPEENEA
jgi:anti-sigma factor RsiW